MAMGRLAAWVYIGLVCTFLLAPMLVVVPLSLTSGTMLVLPTPGYSLRWYEEVFSSPLWLNAARNSVVIGVASAGLSTFLGTLAALGAANSRSRLVRVMAALIVAPLVVPLVLTAVALFYVFARLGLAQSYTGIILAHTALGAPFVFILVGTALKSLDPTLLRAAAALGGSPVHVFRTITLPMVSPGIMSGALFAFAASFDELVIVLFLASPGQRTLPREIFSGIQENISPAIAAVAVIMMVVASLLLILSESIRRRGERMRVRTGGI